MSDARSSEEFWTDYQPGFRLSDRPVGTPEFFAEVERERYALEPEIWAEADFSTWRGCDVLEAGCGIATDGINFARQGALYTGVDFSASAVALARERFSAESVPGTIVRAAITELPVEDDSQDLVYSNGVIHHLADTERAVDEMYRVLRPGGQAIVMVYHRSSINYRLTIMLVRRMLAGLTLLPGAPAAIARVTGEHASVLLGHRDLLRTRGLRYLSDTSLFLSNNTDGPGNPLAKVYSTKEALEVFHRFGETACDVRSLNLRLYPGGRWFERTRVGTWLERRWGWHLWIHAKKTLRVSERPSGERRS